MEVLEVMWYPDFIDDVKRYLKLNEPGLDHDNVLIEECIDRAESHLENWTNRYLKAREETRVFDYPADDPSYLLMRYEDLQEVITLTNGDGTVISAYNFVYEPANRGEGAYRKPAYAIRLINDAYFTYEDNPYQCIKVRAWWGYQMEPDALTKQALIRLTCFFYKQKDSQVFDTTSFVDGGVLVIPDGVPKYVADFVKMRSKR